MSTGRLKQRNRPSWRGVQSPRWSGRSGVWCYWGRDRSEWHGLDSLSSPELTEGSSSWPETRYSALSCREQRRTSTCVIKENSRLFTHKTNPKRTADHCVQVWNKSEYNSFDLPFDKSYNMWSWFYLIQFNNIWKHFSQIYALRPPTHSLFIFCHGKINYFYSSFPVKQFKVHT